jgi:hypothetical protein
VREVRAVQPAHIASPDAFGAPPADLSDSEEISNWNSFIRVSSALRLTLRGY